MPILETPTAPNPPFHSEKHLDEATSPPLDFSSLSGTRIEERKCYESSTNSSPDGHQNPFLGVPHGSHLDPASQNFSARAWILNLAGFMSKDPQRYSTRSAGVSFKHLNVWGHGSPTDYQKTVGNIPLEVGAIFRWMTGTRKHRIQILTDFDGVVQSGEMLLVLGRPGSGCSTLLKTLSGDTNGLVVDSKSEINYQGIPPDQMHKQFSGEAIYMAETDVHFPQLTVGQSLLFAAKARAPRDFTFPGGVTREVYALHMRDVVMATFGLTHTINTNVGSDLVKGVSGGERKRVSIAEAALSGSPLQCWDNSTRGLDSANALEFCKTVRLLTEFTGVTACVSLYQGSQDAYEVFDKVTVLYEGRQIFFGPCNAAKSYFTNMGFECARRQTTPDFLTSLTSPAERLIKPDFENKTPRTAEEFVIAWKASQEYSNLLSEIDGFDAAYPLGGKSVDHFVASRSAQQAKQQRCQSPYTLSIYQQVMLCVERGFQRLKGDASVTISRVVGNIILALVVGSVFYNLEDNTSSFYSRSVLLFFSILLNAFASALEVIILFAQRPIVEKHTRYAWYHPFAEAIASALCDMPYKICNCVSSNLVLYFMTNLRREPAAFFTFLAFSFFTTLALSMVFRTIGAASRSLVQALSPQAIIILALVVYTGFVIPLDDMKPWFRWINYIDPIAYAFESLMINEYDARYFDCGNFIPTGPGYLDVDGLNHICATVGAVAGSNVVRGTDYIKLSFNYERSHLWRNFAIIIALIILFTITYLAASEFVTAKKPKGEVLLFRRGRGPTSKVLDLESSFQSLNPNEFGTVVAPQRLSGAIQKQTSTFQWKNICYDIQIKKEQRRILDRVDGWVKPGTLTALMGPSGAGKTTLLDVLATRDTIGVASGEVLVDGRPRDISFQRKTGYAQQQDIHLETTTVREALRFSAIMRQPSRVSRKDKLAYVEEVIKLLGMEAYADAIVGVPGDGLNIEQRKKLTIGVELAARPQLLLFLDEPSSGLDSQTSWSILNLLETLKSHGQAILCTIHQPSAMLFQRFDRLLFLSPEGKTVYFGEIGESSSTVTSYFERNGAKPCPIDANPAEWIMETIGCTPGSHSNINWPEVWRASPEFALIHRELEEMESQLKHSSTMKSAEKSDFREFAAPFMVQLWECFKRVNSQYWRTPSYIYSKTALSALTALFLGFSFYKADNSLQGLQNQTFSVFMLITMSSNFVPQILPNLVTQRSIYEARERPAKTYSWQVFLLSNILVELPWNTLMSVLIFLCWYYPIGFYRNAIPTDAVAERGVTMFLLMWVYMMYTSTFAQMIQAGVELAEMAGNFANLLFIFSLVFCGILATPTTFPGFWLFMYRASPFTYLISAILSVGLANASVTCSSIELLRFGPLPNTTCGSYMAPYIEFAGGYLTNPSAVENCEFCVMADTNTFLEALSSNYDDRWRNFGILWVYMLVNVVLAIGLYWLVRVPKKGKRQRVGEGEVVVAKEGKSVGTIAIKSSCMKRAFCFLGSETVV